MAKARAMMDEHNIDEEDLIKREPQAAYDSMRSEAALKRTQIFKHELFVALAVSQICDCGMYTSKSNKRDEVYFFGLPTDVAIAKVFYAELLIAVKIMARAKLGSTWKMEHFYYCEGFAYRVLERSRELKSRSTLPGLVLCKDALLKRYNDEKLHLRASPLSGASKRSGAFEQGYRDGAAYDLGVDSRLGSAQLGGVA
jgi:hypothetical protein